MSYWEKSVITVTDLQNTPDFFRASHNDSIHPSGSSTLLLAVLCCVFMCCPRFALRKQPWNHQRSFSLASRCHVVSANTCPWTGRCVHSTGGCDNAAFRIILLLSCWVSYSGGAGAASSLPQLLLRAQPNYQFEIAQSTEHSFKKCNNLHFTEKDWN